MKTFNAIVLVWLTIITVLLGLTMIKLGGWVTHFLDMDLKTVQTLETVTETLEMTMEQLDWVHGEVNGIKTDLNLWQE